MPSAMGDNDVVHAFRAQKHDKKQLTSQMFPHFSPPSLLPLKRL